MFILLLNATRQWERVSFARLRASIRHESDIRDNVPVKSNVRLHITTNQQEEMRRKKKKGSDSLRLKTIPSYFSLLCNHLRPFPVHVNSRVLVVDVLLLDDSIRLALDD